MSNEEIIEGLRNDIILYYNSTDDPFMKEKLQRMLNDDVVLSVKCPKCGTKFGTKENLKYSIKIL